MKKIIKRFWWIALIVVFLILIVPVPVQCRCIGEEHYCAITYKITEYDWSYRNAEDRPNGLESGYKVVILGFTVYDDAVERTEEM